MSDQTTLSAAIIAEENERLRQAQEAEAQRQLLEQPWVELRKARDGVSFWLTSDGIVAHRDTMEEKSPATAIPAIARLYKTLTACDSLGQLAATPSGIEDENRKAWQVAWDILRLAPDSPSEAAELLGSIRRLPFAGDVVWWLCDGFKKVVEGNWHDGGLFRNMAGMGPEMPDIDTAESRAQPEAEGSTAAASGMTWQDAAERLKRLRAQGEPWTSQVRLARLFRCSSGTINKAIKNTPDLHVWAYPETAGTPRAQTLNDLLIDRTAERRELKPMDDAAIREFIESADPEVKAWFLALPVDEQLKYLNDPDKHTTILGRRP